MTINSMGADQTDNLFLLEVLIKEIQYCYENIKLDKSYLEKLKGTCVLVKFLHYPPLEIHQEAADGVDFNSPIVRMDTGKSCLFSLNKNKIMTNEKLNMVLSVNRLSGDCKCVPIGKATVDMTKNVCKLMKQAGCCAAPSTQCIDDTLDLINEQVEKIGIISVFVRISCFGNQITTQFKMNGEGRESFVFRGADQNENLDNPSDRFSSNNIQDGLNNGYFGTDIVAPCFNFPEPDFRNNTDYPNFGFPGMGAAAPPFGPGNQGLAFPVSMCYQDQPPCPMPCQGGAEQNFQSCGGGGGAGPHDGVYQYGKPLEDRREIYPGVKLPRPPAEPRPCNCPRSKTPCTDMSKGKKGCKDQQAPKEYPFCQRVTIGETESEEEDTKMECPKLNLCDCDYPTPPGLNCPPPERKKKKSKPPCPLDVQPGDYCLRADCPCGLPIVPWLAKPEQKQTKDRACENFTLAPGSVGIKGKQFIYQMNEKNVSMSQDEKKFISSTQYKVGTVGDKDGQKNVIQVLPEINRDPKADKEHDIFILKVGKKNDLNKKAKLEIELRSPKLEDNTPQKREGETQWSDSDVPAGGGKKGADPKGAKKNGKKGKK